MEALSPNFAVVGMPRCGSYWLCHLLDQHPQVRCLEEIFHPLLNDPARMVDTDRYWAECWQASPKAGARARGYKLLYYQYQDSVVVRRWIRGQRRQQGAIHLVRNPVVSLVSLLEAERSGVWYTSDPARRDLTRSQIPVSVQSYRFSAFVREAERSRRSFARMWPRRLLVPYRELVRDTPGWLTQIWDFLGVPPCAVTVPDLRLSGRPIRERVDNWDDLVRAFPQYAHYFTAAQDPAV